MTRVLDVTIYVLLVFNIPIVTGQTLTPQLIWGDLRSSSLASYASTVITAAKTYALTAGTAVAVIDGSTPSNAAISRLNFLFQIALCSWMTQDPTCTASAIQGLTVWVPLYRPTGNPVNEYNFLGWLQSYDLMRPYIAANASGNLSALDSFTYSFIPALDNYGGAVATDQYFTKKLVIRTFASMILSNQTEIANSMQMINNEAPLNIYPSGATFEFVKRDSLALHLTTMLAWVQIALQASKICNTTTLRLIEAGTNFLQQFVNGSIAHQEFKLSTYSSDNANKALNLTWVNTTAYTFLLQADIIFPSVYAWDTAPPAVPRSAFSLNYWTWGALRLYYTLNPLFVSTNTSVTTTVPTSTAVTTTVPTSTATTTTVPTSTATTTPSAVGAPVTFNVSQLIWGDLSLSQLSGDRNYIISTAITATLTNGTAVAVLDGSTPANTATSRLPTLLNIALCSVVTQNPSCTASAIQGLTVWAPLYKPTGNAGNEYNFVPWLQAYDLMRPYLVLNGTYSTVVATLDSFAYSFIPALDSQYGSSTSPDMYRTERFLVRAFASIVIGNQTEINNSMALIEQHAITNMFSDGTTYDYKYHDSLAWHLKTLGFWIQIATQAPFVCSTNTLRLLENCTNFLQLFVNGSVIHQEYMNSQTSSDNTNKALNLTWVNTTSYTYLIQADPFFPSVYAWDISIPSTVRNALYSIQKWLWGTLRVYYASNPVFGRITTQAASTSSSTTTTQAASTSSITTTTLAASTSSSTTTTQAASTSSSLATTQAASTSSSLATTQAASTSSSLATTQAAITSSSTAPVSTQMTSTSTGAISSSPAITSSSGALVYRDSQLIWGNITAPGWSSHLYWASKSSTTASNTPYTAVSAILADGVLPTSTDPAYLASIAATAQISSMLSMAVCARYEIGRAHV